MIKMIPIEFKADFTPPEKFDGAIGYGSTRQCTKCPFYYAEIYEPVEVCVLLDTFADTCPIKKYFD